MQSVTLTRPKRRIFSAGECGVSVTWRAGGGVGRAAGRKKNESGENGGPEWVSSAHACADDAHSGPPIFRRPAPTRGRAPPAARASGPTSREYGETDTVNPETTALGGRRPYGIRPGVAGAAAT